MEPITVSINVKLVFRCHDRAMYVRDPNGHHNIPGGHLQNGETPIDGLRRELQEELRYTLTQEPKLINIWGQIKPSEPTRLLIGYLLDVSQELTFLQVPQDVGEEGAECVWVHKKDISTLGLDRWLETLLQQAVTLPKS